MSEIQRWEVGFSQMNEHSQGEFITWNDHVAALKAARNELPDVGSWTPEPKFKVGDRVVTRLETYPWVIVAADYVVEDGDWYYRSDHYRAEHEALLDLYVPPTPAELIPTLVDRVRDMKHACIQAVQYVLDDYEEYEVTTKEIKFAILEMLRNTQVTYDEPETEVKR